MTQNEKIFTRLLNQKGYSVSYINWEPVCYNTRDGREGGWEIMLDIDDEDLHILDNVSVPILGYNKKEIICAIDFMPNLKTKNNC